jgi:hypothetical protein
MAENDEALETEQTDDESGREVDALGAPSEMKHLDFITSIVLMILSVATLPVSYGYFQKSRKAFYASPGFMPIIIAAALFLLGLSLMLQSLKDSSVKENLRRLIDAAPRGFRSLRFRNSVIGLGFFGVYIYILLRFLPFWLASLILLFVCFIFLKASGFVKCVIISGLSVGGIVLIFQIVFRVPMP